MDDLDELGDLEKLMFWMYWEFDLEELGDLEKLNDLDLWGDLEE